MFAAQKTFFQLDKTALIVSSKKLSLINQSGFTLLELLIVLSLVSLLTAFLGLNFIRPQTVASLDTTVKILNSELRQQQIKAVAGDSEGTGNALSFGIYFETSRYTIFRGSSHEPGNPGNFVVDLPPNVTFSTIDIPNSQIVFDRRSGEVSGYDPTSNSLTVANNTGQARTIVTNRYGVLTIN